MPDKNSDAGHLRTLLQLGATLNVSLKLAQVLRIAIDQVVQFVRAERGFILLVDTANNKVWGHETHGIDQSALENALSGKDPNNVPQISRTIIEEALRDRRAVLSTNAMEDPRFAAHTSVQLSQVRSVLCVPLIAQGTCLGIVYIDNRMKENNFDDHDAEMLTAFANQAAVAIQNARLYDNLRKSSDDKLRLQNELHKKETQRVALEEANRVKSDFIGYISHELRNPLTTIRGFVQTMAADTEDILGKEVRMEFYETIEVEADRMLTMINELLDSSRLEAGRALYLNSRKLDIAPLLHRLTKAQKFDKFWTPKHKMVSNIANDLPEIEVDEDKILQIVSNLLSNAVKYSPDGGAVTVSVSASDEHMTIEVSDEGLGMNEEQSAKLFGHYERIDRDDIKSISGTGLGLYLTKHLVELHHGTIVAKSESGKGSTFTVTLPLLQPKS